jgi:hypothetical protein
VIYTHSTEFTCIYQIISQIHRYYIYNSTGLWAYILFPWNNNGLPKVNKCFEHLAGTFLLSSGTNCWFGGGPWNAPRTGDKFSVLQHLASENPSPIWLPPKHATILVIYLWLPQKKWLQNIPRNCSTFSQNFNTSIKVFSHFIEFSINL